MTALERLLVLPATMIWLVYEAASKTPLYLLPPIFVAVVGSAHFAIYLLLHLMAPEPRAPFPSEKTYVTSTPDGTPSQPRQLPCWFDRWLAESRLRKQQQRTQAGVAGGPEKDDEGNLLPEGFSLPDAGTIEPAEVEMSVVIPAYNEADRIIPTLEEMVDYLDATYGRPGDSSGAEDESEEQHHHHHHNKDPAAETNTTTTTTTNESKRFQRVRSPAPAPHRLVFRKGSNSSFASSSSARQDARAAMADAAKQQPQQQQQQQEKQPVKKPEGYEIIIVNDGSRDATAAVALDFARRRGLHDVLRVVELARNRGKGGGVTHGLRHVRGEWAVFADADGASRFSDLAKLVDGCNDVVDASNRGVAIGSRAHLVGSEAVVKRSAIRNFLMRSFHFLLTILTPPATSRIRDTQCGFKLFTRAALPHIVPYMHAQGWHFDIEMLMLAESAPATPVLSAAGAVIGSTAGIRVAEVPITWREVEGSKMSLVQDSLRMALGIAVLRASWMMGVYRRRLT